MYSSVFTDRFHSNYFEEGLGFELRYEYTDVEPTITYRIGACGGNFSTPEGTLTSPYYPDKYPDGTDCVYTIARPAGTTIQLYFHSLDINSHSSCRYDYLEIRDGSSDNSAILGKLCGKEIPISIRSTQNKMWIRFIHIKLIGFEKGNLISVSLFPQVLFFEF